MTWITSPIELIAAISSLVAVLLAARANALTWPTGLIGVFAYGILFWQIKLYADFGLQIVFFAQSLYGWYLWRQGPSQQISKPAPVLHYPTRQELLISAAFIVLFAPALGWALQSFTDASLPFADATLATLSLVATWLLARKSLANWPLWILADIGYIALFLSKGLAVSALLYLIFLGLCIHGWIHWRRLIAEANP